MKKQTTNFVLDFILLILIFSFPLIIVFKSAAINITTVIISIIILFYIFKKTQFDIFKNKLVIYIFFFISYIFINSVIYFKSFDLLLKSLGNFRYLLLSVAVLFVFEKISEKKKFFFIYFNVIIIFLIKLDILYQFIFGRDFFGFTPGMCGEICHRFSGVFGDELIAGSYLSQIGLLILMLFLNLDLNKSFYNFFIKPFLLIFLLLIILVTGERAALLIVIISFFFISYFKKKIIKFFFTFLLLLTLIFFSSQKIESINVRFVKVFDSWDIQSEDNTIISKINNSPWLTHYKAAIELFIEKPIIGHGPKSFRVKCANTNIEKEIIKKSFIYTQFFSTACSNHPHNYLLEFLTEHGIVGGIFFIGLFCFLFIIIYKKAKNSKNENIIMLIATGSLILAIIFPFKPSGSFFSTFNASMLFYIFGFFLYYLKKVK